MKKILSQTAPPPLQNPLKQKNQGTLSECWAFPLTAWNFYFQNCLSLFLAWANTPIINWGYLVLEHITESAWDSDVFVGSTLMDMYAKCGSMEYVGEYATLKCGHL